MLLCLLFQAPNESHEGASCHNRLSRLMNLVNLKASFKLALSSQANLHPLCNCIYNWLKALAIFSLEQDDKPESRCKALSEAFQEVEVTDHMATKNGDNPSTKARHVFITILFYAFVNVLQKKFSSKCFFINHKLNIYLSVYHLTWML